MIKNNLAYIIIIGAIIGLSLLGYHWHNTTVEAKTQEAIAEEQGKNVVLTQMIANKQAQADSLKKELNKAIESANKIKHDTILVYNTALVQKNNIIALGTDASIGLLSKNLSGKVRN